jgi:hypothetical protein
LGYDPDEALSLGKSVAGLNAQTKGRRLGILKAPPTPAVGGPPKKRGLGEEFWVELCGRAVPAKRTKEGIRAVVKDQPILPRAVAPYLERKFGGSLGAVRQAMVELAKSFEPAELARVAFALYEKFRPVIAPGKRGWGQKGDLDLDLMRSLTKK